MCMKIAFGVKAHSGWAALVAIGKRGSDFAVVDRRRIELVEDPWAKQPYHAAEKLKPDAAREMVTRGIEAAHRAGMRVLAIAHTAPPSDLGAADIAWPAIGTIDLDDMLRELGKR